MKTTSLSADQVRSIAHATGLCFSMVSQAMQWSREHDQPCTRIHSVLRSPTPGAPPEAAVLVMFTAHAPDPADDGWAGLMVEGITNQQELNNARSFFEHFVREHFGHRVEGIE